MKKEDLQELKKRPLNDLQERLRKEREKLNDLQFNVSMGKVKNIAELKNIKKNVARILTIINKKQNNA